MKKASVVSKEAKTIKKGKDQTEGFGTNQQGWYASGPWH